MKEIGLQILREAITSYTWTNRSCWASFFAIAGWSAAYTMNPTNGEVLGAWWDGGNHLYRLIWFIIIFIIIAYLHKKELTFQNEKRKKALYFLIVNKLLPETVRDYFDLSLRNFDHQYKKDRKLLLLALIGFLIILALPSIRHIGIGRNLTAPSSNTTQHK